MQRINIQNPVAFARPRGKRVVRQYVLRCAARPTMRGHAHKASVLGLFEQSCRGQGKRSGDAFRQRLISVDSRSCTAYCVSNEVCLFLGATPLTEEHSSCVFFFSLTL